MLRGSQGHLALNPWLGNFRLTSGGGVPYPEAKLPVFAQPSWLWEPVAHLMLCTLYIFGHSIHRHSQDSCSLYHKPILVTERKTIDERTLLKGYCA